MLDLNDVFKSDTPWKTFCKMQAQRFLVTSAVAISVGGTCMIILLLMVAQS